MRRLLLRMTLLLAAFTQGALLGTVCLLLLRPRTPEPAVIESPGENAAASAPERQRAFDLVREAADGHRLLEDGDPHGAMVHYWRILDRPHEAIDPITRADIAVSLEAIGEPQAAVELYETLLRDAGPPLRAAAERGLTRCRLALGQRSLAERMMWRDFLAAGGPAAAESAYWLGLALAADLAAAAADPLTDPAGLISIPPRVDAARVARQVIEASMDGLASAPSPSATHYQLTPQASDDGLLRLEVRAEGIVLLPLLRAVAAAAQQEISISDRAVERAERTPLSIRVSGVDPALLLDALTWPNDLSWATRDGALYVDLEMAADPVERERGREAAAIRVLEWALQAAGDHDLANAARIAVANIEFWQGRLEASAARYQAILDAPGAQLATQEAHFNLGKILRAAGRFDEAMDQMLRVVENARLGHTLTLGYLTLGRMQLESGLADEAVQSFSRAARVADDRRHQQLALVQLAAAHLLSDRPALAAQLLRQHAGRIDPGALAGWARFLRAVADCKDQPALREQAEADVIATLPPMDTLGTHEPAWLYLAGQALRTLGFQTEADRWLDASLRASPTPYWRCRVGVELAEHLAAARQWNEARRVLAELPAAPAAPCAAQILLLSVHIDLETRQFDRAFETCMQLLDEPEVPGEIRGEALRLLGRVHQQWGHYEQAALCFAGLLPQPERGVDR